MLSGQKVAAAGGQRRVADLQLSGTEAASQRSHVVG
jgi:hypothetical protein